MHRIVIDRVAKETVGKDRTVTLITQTLYVTSPLLYSIHSTNNQIANVEPLLFKYRVNVAFYGHNHVVQRHSATFNKTVVQKSVATTDSNVSLVTDKY